MLAGAYPCSAVLGMGGRHPTQTFLGTHHAPLRTLAGVAWGWEPAHHRCIKAGQGGSSVPFLPPTSAPAVLSVGRGTVTNATYMGATGVALGGGGARDCSRFIAEETRAEPGLRTAAAVKDKEKPFHVQGCQCRAVVFLAQLLPAWDGGGHTFGAQAVGGGGSSPACGSKGAFRSRTKGFLALSYV